MPYILEGEVCKPSEVNSLEEGDVVVVKPFTAFVNGKAQVFPPLSVVSRRKCVHEIVTPIWVDGIRVKGNVRVVEGDMEILGELEVLSQEFLPGFTAKEAIGKTKFKVSSSLPGVPIITVGGKPLISIANGEILLTDRRTLLLILAQALNYYLSSQE